MYYVLPYDNTDLPSRDAVDGIKVLLDVVATILAAFTDSCHKLKPEDESTCSFLFGLNETSA